MGLLGYLMAMLDNSGVACQNGSLCYYNIQSNVPEWLTIFYRAACQNGSPCLLQSSSVPEWLTTERAWQLR